MTTTDSGTLDLLKQFYKDTDISKLLDKTISAEELKYDLQDPWDPYKLELDSVKDIDMDIEDKNKWAAHITWLR